MVMLYSKTKPQEFAEEVRETRPLGALVITVEEWAVDTSGEQQASREVEDRRLLYKFLIWLTPE